MTTNELKKIYRRMLWVIPGMVLAMIGDYCMGIEPKAKPYIKGAEHCKAWEVKEWLIKLAIPGHALGWTLLVCPIAGLIVAGIGILLG